MVVGYINSEAVNQRELSAYEYSEAGILSGIATRALIQPLDVLKIRFQLQEEPLKGEGRGKYGGILQSLRLIRREEGILAFWKGHVPAQGLSAIYGLVQFTTFEILSLRLKQFEYFEKSQKLSDFCCGALAGCSAIYRGAFHASRKIWRMEKIPGLFRGITPSLTQIAPFTGLQFAFYNFFNEFWNHYIENYESSGKMICGAAAGTISKTILYPLDLIRHRLQVNTLIRRSFGRTTLERGMIRTFIGVIQRETIFGLFKGLTPSMLKAGANSGFAFLFYELACDLLRSIKK